MARPEPYNQFADAIRATNEVFAWLPQPHRTLGRTGRPQSLPLPPPLGPLRPGGTERPWQPRHFPADVVALIERAPRSPMQSGRRLRGWRLSFPRRSRQFHDPLTGWIGGTDPLAHVELSFPSLEAAIRYAEREGLAYEVREPTARRKSGGAPATESAEPLSLCCWPTGPHALCCGDYPPARQEGGTCWTSERRTASPARCC